MRPRSALFGLTLAVSLLASGPPAAAVIRVDMPVSRIYATADVVAIGTVVGVNADSRVVEVKVTHALKGKLTGGRLRVQVAAAAALIGDLAAGRAMVMFATEAGGKGLGVLHLGDTWLQAESVPGARPPAWRAGRVADLKHSFPGRTPALVRIVRDIKAGKAPILDKVEQNYFRGGVRELAKLDVVKPKFLLAADVNGDARADLLVALADGVRLFTATGAGFVDVTAKWGLARAAGAYAAFGDASGDGRADLLLGATLWINVGRKFVGAKAGLELPGKARPLAAALTDVTGDKKPDAVVLLADGRLLTFENPAAKDRPWRRRAIRALWKGGAAPAAAAFGDWGDDGRPHVMVVRNTGITRYAIGANGGAPADDERLTGKRLVAYYRLQGGELRNVLATTLDANGDKRPDFLLVAEGGPAMLVNRGFGTFFILLGAAEALTSHGQYRPPFKLTPATAWTAADVDGDGLDDILVLADDGRLYVASNRSRTPPRK